MVAGVGAAGSSGPGAGQVWGQWQLVSSGRHIYLWTERSRWKSGSVGVGKGTPGHGESLLRPRPCLTGATGTADQSSIPKSIPREHMGLRRQAVLSHGLGVTYSPAQGAPRTPGWALDVGGELREGPRTMASSCKASKDRFSLREARCVLIATECVFGGTSHRGPGWRARHLGAVHPPLTHTPMGCAPKA